jgi:glycosyltransferase involved in cell wall biosynthesis
MNSHLLVVSPEFGSGGIGGHTRRVVNFLIEDGFKITVHANKGFLARNVPHPSLQINELAQPIFGFSLFNPFFDLLSSLRIDDKAKPDLILRTLPPFYPYIPKISNTTIPELVISHGVLPSFEVLKKYNKMGLEDKLTLSPIGKPLLQSEKKMLQKADCVVAVSEYTKRTMMEYYGIEESKIAVVYNFVDTSIFAKKQPCEITSDLGQKIKDFKGDSLLSVFVAQLPVGGAKNFDLLFDVMTASKKLNIKFVVVGMGPDHQYAKSYARRLGLNRVLFLGYVNNALLPEVYSLSNFLLITSLYENLPTVLLEAMACGAIPISTAIGGVSEALQNHVNGLLVSPSKTDFLNALSELCQNDQHTLSAISNKNVAKIRENFDALVVKKRYIEIVHSLVKN